MTQIPWADKLLYKNAIMATLKKQSGNSILKIAADSVSERKQKIKDNPGNKESKGFNDRDFLSRFLEIESANTSIPQW